MICYRELSGDVLSDLPSPGSVGRPARGVFARTCAGDRKVDIYDMFPTPGTNTPSTFRGHDVWNVRYVRTRRYGFLSQGSRGRESRAEEPDFAS